MNQLSLQALRSFSGVGSIDLHAPSTALLVVDVQSGYVLRDGFTIRRLLDRGLDDAAAQYERQLQVAVPNMRRLLDQARARGQFVIFVNSVNYPGQRGPGGQTINQWIPPNSAEADIVEALDRRPEELLLSKTCSGTFAGTNADLHLRRYGVTSLIVCGVVTDGCVEQAIRQAHDLGYACVLVSDACAALTDEIHVNALERLEHRRAHVRSTDDVLASSVIEATTIELAGARTRA